ncbi:hypothetical protein GYMLUDRAFT_45876 [Collybiopsis luxurians FD-317 M1]|uniref:Uncharacterized protein n=1 Tax=Collybiopsis luxurians FD-317 M1 TaxID=944289 RepID=A0A0D0C5D3_9AGAR|nr:hypothetical protein GYMLUDRAFT_45876 [Collybiopsis luxurians FD-317 M1]
MQSRYTNLETATESGVLYLVPNENGKGKRVIRKPHPPPTSIPMDENFDAYTLETREPVTEAETVQGRPTSWAPTSPPLDEDFDAWTYTNTAGPVTGTGTLYEEEYHADSEDAEDERDGELVAGDERSESRRRRNRPLRRRKRLGRSGPLTVSASRDSDNEGPPNGYEATTARHHNGVRAQYDDGAGPSHHYPPAENHRPPQEATERSLSMIPSSSKIVANGHPDTGQGHYKSQARSIMISGNGKHKSGTRNRKRNDHTRQTVSRRGPVAHDFEVVNSRVLEEGPERTVTISTWRERVANEARRSEVEMSVYYLNADDYVMDPEPEHEREPFRASLNSLTRPKKEKGKQDLFQARILQK